MNHESSIMNLEGDLVPQAYAEMPLVQRAHVLAKRIYQETKHFPREELYGLTSQLRRASASVPANICEGKGHRNDKELYRYLCIARASLAEVLYLLFFAKDVGILPASTYRELFLIADEVGRMLVGLQKYLRGNMALRRTPPKRGCPNS